MQLVWKRVAKTTGQTFSQSPQSKSKRQRGLEPCCKAPIDPELCVLITTKLGSTSVFSLVCVCVFMCVHVCVHLLLSSNHILAPNLFTQAVILEREKSTWLQWKPFTVKSVHSAAGRKVEINQDGGQMEGTGLIYLIISWKDPGPLIVSKQIACSHTHTLAGRPIAWGPDWAPIHLEMILSGTKSWQKFVHLILSPVSRC